MTPYTYAKKCYSEGRSPSMCVMNAGDRFLICDGDWGFLKTKTSYASREEAQTVISKTLDRARKFI